MQRLTALFHKIPENWRWALLVWLAGRLGLSLWGLLIWNMTPPAMLASNEHYYNIPPIIEGIKGALLGVWQRWDGVHYQQIAQYGYHSNDALSAFFPLYPLLARGLNALTGMGALPALLVISSLSFLAALAVLYRLVEEDFSAQTARAATVVTSLFPTAFFFYAAYPHALTLLLTLLSYQSARHHHWPAAVLAGICAGLAHSTVIPLALMLAYEVFLFLKTHRQPLHWLAAIVPFSPLMGVALFLSWRIQQNFPSFSGLMDSIWGRMLQWPWQTLAQTAAQFIHGPVHASMIYDFPLLLLAAGLLVWGWKRLPLSPSIYVAALIVYLLTNSIRGQPLESFGRYILMDFPMFATIGILAAKKAVRLSALTVGLFALALLSAVFFLWGWVD